MRLPNYFACSLLVEAFNLNNWIEAIHRAHLEADNKEVITAQDIQRILPQLLLDF